MSGQSFRCGGQLCDASRLLDFTQIDMNSMFLSPSEFQTDFPTNPPIPRLQTLENRKEPEPSVRSCLRLSLQSAITDGVGEASDFDVPQAAGDARLYFLYAGRDGGGLIGNSSNIPIFQGIEKMQLLSRYSLPTVDTLAPVTPWPNKHVPSDHLPIIAKFRLSKLN